MNIEDIDTPEKLKQRRIDALFSQSECAKEIGVVRQTYLAIEKGTRELTISEAKKLCIFLDQVSKVKLIENEIRLLLETNKISETTRIFLGQQVELLKKSRTGRNFRKNIDN